MTVLFFDKVMASSRLNAFEFFAVLYNHHPLFCILYSALQVLISECFLRYDNIKKLLVRT